MRSLTLLVLPAPVPRIEPEDGYLLCHPALRCRLRLGPHRPRIPQVQTRGRRIVEIVPEHAAGPMQAAVDVTVAPRAQQAPHPPGEVVVIDMRSPLLAAGAAHRPEPAHQTRPQTPQHVVPTLVPRPG